MNAMGWGGVAPAERAAGLVYGPGCFGATPFGTGLDVWQRDAAGFNMDRMRTPLRIVAITPKRVLHQWEWYAGLRRLGKPVELFHIPNGAHSLVKPLERMAAMQGTVDWFRFWLLDQEDVASAKEAQYARWRDMRNDQRASGR